jgi:hypothetical protein
MVTSMAIIWRWREKASTLLTSDGYVSWAGGGREGRMEKARRCADDMVGSRKEATWRLKGGLLSGG